MIERPKELSDRAPTNRAIGLFAGSGTAMQMLARVRSMQQRARRGNYGTLCPNSNVGHANRMSRGQFMSDLIFGSARQC